MDSAVLPPEWGSGMGDTDYDTGPFCRHWGDPSDCDIECAHCGCRCPEHGQEEGDFECYNCDNCETWEELE